MASWDMVGCNYDTVDETINFGTRALAEAEGAFYITSTLATIDATGEVLKSPNVRALATPKYFFIAIDSVIYVLDEQYSKVLMRVEFETQIDCFCVTKKEDIVILALRDGTVHCLDICQEGESVLSQFVEENADFTEPCIAAVFCTTKEKAFEIHCVCRSGHIYKINSSFNVNSSANESLCEISTCEQFPRTHKLHKPVLTAKITNNAGLFIAGKEIRKIFEEEEIVVPFNKSMPGIKKIQAFENEMLLLCLTEDGFLSSLCPITLQLFPIWNEQKIKDFILLEESVDSVNLLLLTEPSENKNASIQYISYPEFETIYQFEVSAESFLVPLVENFVDEPLFIEGISKNSKGSVNSLRIKSITESVPELRLSKLLSRNQFDDAEQFAIKFGLDKQLVYEAKVKWFLNTLTSNSKVYDSEEKIRDFVAILDKIEDVVLVTECCKNIFIRDIQQVHRLLEYAADRLKKFVQKDTVNDQIQMLKVEMFNILLLLETYQLVCECDKTPPTQESWINFMKTDLITTIKTFLSHEEFIKASLTWCRHQHNILRSETIKEEIMDLLYSQPLDSPLELLLPWLKNFLPTAISLHSDVLHYVVQFTIDKTMSLENSDRNLWPEIGLEFTEHILTLLNVEKNNNTETLVLYQQHSKDSPLQQLFLFINALEKLTVLKYDHNIYISLQTFLQSDITDVVTHLLDSVQPHRIKPLFTEFLDQFMLQNDLQPDSVLQDYINAIVYNSNTNNWCTDTEAPWERHVVPLIECLRGTEVRMVAIIKVLSAATVPWSERLETLAANALTLQHPMTAKIERERLNVAVKLLLKKYNCKSVSNINDDRVPLNLIKRIIKSGLPTQVDDIKSVVKSNPELNEKAFVLLVYSFVSKGHFKQAVAMLNDLEQKIALECANYVISAAKSNLTFKYPNMDRAHKFHEFLPLLSEFFGKTLKKDLQHQAIMNKIINLRNIYILKVQFDMYVLTDDYLIESCRSDLLDKCVLKEVNKLKEIDNFTSKEVEAACMQLIRASAVLKFKTIDALHRFAQSYNDKRVISFVARYIIPTLDCDLTSEIASLQCKLALQLLANYKPEFDPFAQLNDTDLNQTIEDISLAHQLVRNACLKDETDAYVEIARWTSIACDIISDSAVNSQTEASHKSLVPIYRDFPIGSSVLAAVTCFQDVFYVILNLLSSKPNKILDDSDTWFRKLTEDELISHLSRLQTLIRQLQASQYDLAAFRMLSAFHSFILGLDCSKLTVNVQKMLSNVSPLLYKNVPQLLYKVVNMRKMDASLGLSLLNMGEKRDAYKWIMNAQKLVHSDVKKSGAVARLGIAYCDMIKDFDSLREKLEAIALRTRWAQKLSVYGVSSKSVLTQPPNLLVSNLMTMDHFTIDNLRQFCTDFGLDFQQMIVLCLKMALLTWKPDIEITTSVLGKKDIIIKNSETELFKKCCEIITHIEDIDVVMHNLHKWWPLVNFYHYEVYICILTLRSTYSDSAQSPKIEYMLLKHLKKYKRIQQPQQVEKENWHSKFSDANTLPEIASWRLPFTAFSSVENIKSFVYPEINLFTYRQWMEIGQLIKIDPNTICVNAVQQTVRSDLWKSITTSTGQEKEESWYIYPRCTDLFSRIEQCVNEISNVEFASSLWYLVLNNTPPGADRFKAAAMCYQLAQEWAKTGHAHCLDKVKKKYLSTSSLHILYSHGLGSMASYINTPHDPQDLIRVMYEHPSIPERVRSPKQQAPNINKAVDEISALYSLNIAIIRQELIQQWLQLPEVGNPYGSPDDTFCLQRSFSAPENMQSSDQLNDEKLLRVCYICQAVDVKISIVYLFGIGIGTKCDLDETCIDMDTTVSLNGAGDSAYCLSTRLRAMQCLASIADEENLKLQTNWNLHDLRKYIRTLSYLSQLEQLGVMYTPEILETCDKERLVEGLWAKFSNNQTAIQLIASLLINYDIKTFSLWEKLLKKMISNLMRDELKTLLSKRMNYDTFMSETVSFEAWNYVIQAPFVGATKPLSPEDEEKCLESLRLFQSCPVASKLDLQKLTELCLSIDRPEMAAILLPFQSKLSRDASVKMILDFKPAVSFKAIEQLSNYGLSTAFQGIEILKLQRWMS